MSPLDRPTVTVDEAAGMLGISSWSLYNSVKDGTCPVPFIRVGKRIVIPTPPLRRLLCVDEADTPEQVGA